MLRGLITVRTLSSRLPGKCFLSFGKYSVLEYVILRSKYYKINPIICTTNHKSDNKIIGEFTIPGNNYLLQASNIINIDI